MQIRGTQGCAYVGDPERDVGEGWDVASACEREQIEILNLQIGSRTYLYFCMYKGLYVDVWLCL